jgi:hypothetical protein
MISSAVMEARKDVRPLTVRLTVWWGYIFAAMYLLYGGVKLVLSILDRQYQDMGSAVIFLVLGLLLIMLAMAYRDSKQWGWIGLIALNGAIVVLALLGLSHVENVVLLIVSLLALVGLLAPSTKAYIIGGR